MAKAIKNRALERILIMGGALICAGLVLFLIWKYFDAVSVLGIIIATIIGWFSVISFVSFLMKGGQNESAPLSSTIGELKEQLSHERTMHLCQRLHAALCNQERVRVIQLALDLKQIDARCYYDPAVGRDLHFEGAEASRAEVFIENFKGLACVDKKQPQDLEAYLKKPFKHA